MKLLASTTAVVTTALLLAAPGMAQKAKPGAKPQSRKPPVVGIKGAGQVTGGVIRFGDLIALKSGFTYQILSARYSLDPFECYGNTFPGTEEKLLILTVAIKNNRAGEDNYFGEHGFTAVDTTGQNHNSGNYMLRSKPGQEFSPTLKPGQGVGQGAADPLEVAIPLSRDARITKLILRQGREGTREEVVRYFIAGSTEAEAGGKPDPKNVIDPLPAQAGSDAILPQNEYAPTWSYAFKLNGFATADKMGDQEPTEGKKWVFALMTVKNPLHAKQDLYDFVGSDSLGEMYLKDTDGERYPASQVLQAKRDEAPSTTLEAGEERALRVAFQVPRDASFKTILLGAPRGHHYLFDATGAAR